MANKSKLISKLVFVIGFVLCAYPLASNLIESFYHRDAVNTYNMKVSDTDAQTLKEGYKKAEDFNKALYDQRKSAATIGTANPILSEDNYNSTLNMGNGVMGSIEIPKINVNLPIYHGTSDEVLSVGVGHVYGSSFPVGGTNTRSVLTGHRGLPNAKLFTRLDEIVKGDLFFVKVFGETLAYKVNDIKVIDPKDVDAVGVVDGKDIVSLITCTPYGINTHRLVVSGERVPFEKDVYDSIKPGRMSFREILFASIPFAFGGIVVVPKVVNIVRNKKKGDNLENEVKED